MKGLLARLRRNASTDRRRAVRPLLEPLEGRMLLYSTTGDMFADPRRITWSLMPDGTSTPGGQSHLYQSMDADFSRSAWVTAITDAFAQWEAVANVNLVFVNDNGAADDSGNLQQGSNYFGDIRIGAFSEGPTIAASTLLPPKANGGSNSGDIFLNTDVAWQMGSGVDLETVVTHEIGHALGMGHSASSSAVMFGNYNGVVSSLTSDDISGIQSVWGPRQEDVYAQQYHNSSQLNAADITSTINASNHQASIGGLDVAKPYESYWFKFTTPNNSGGTMTISAQSTWQSELSPWVQLYSSNFNLLSQAAATSNSYGATMTASIGNMSQNTVYYVRVTGSNGGDTGTGNYALVINAGYNSQSPAPPPGVLVYTQPDQGGGSTAESFGGADKAAPKPDVPDLIPTGATQAQGDDFVLPQSQPRPTTPIYINVPHPASGRRGNRPPQATVAPKKAG